MQLKLAVCFLLLLAMQRTRAFLPLDKSLKKLFDDDPFKIWKPLKDLFEEKKEKEEELFEEVVDKKDKFDDKMKEFFADKNRVRLIKDNIKDALEARDCEPKQPYKPDRKYKYDKPTPKPSITYPIPAPGKHRTYYDCDEEEDEETSYEDKQYKHKFTYDCTDDKYADRYPSYRYSSNDRYDSSGYSNT